MPEDKPDCPTAAILKTREADQRGEFQRRIIARTPYEVDTDRIELECGHTPLMIVTPFSSQLRLNCRRCRNEYLKRESEKNDDLG